MGSRKILTDLLNNPGGKQRVTFLGKTLPQNDRPHKSVKTFKKEKQSGMKDKASTRDQSSGLAEPHNNNNKARNRKGGGDEAKQCSYLFGRGKQYQDTAWCAEILTFREQVHILQK